MLNGRRVYLQLDTASDITIISERLWQSLGSSTMQKTSQYATSAGGGLLRIMGSGISCVFPRHNHHCNATKANLNLLGRDRIKKPVLTSVPFSVWAAPIVVVKKSNSSIHSWAEISNGSNATLTLNCYPLPVLADLLTLLDAGTRFTKLYPAAAYLQFEFVPKPRELMTKNPHYGVFQYTRLPFGVKTGLALFQRKLNAMLSGIPGTARYLGDIITMGRFPLKSKT
ncbi:unnamed protein product [Schistocephalus solidus]|uniref:Peptidase A2 domain-containing protein n=1 Tax=Schistocephalus solidus TaxID=70667 RepID=A0A183TL86_SCHSO|nr:unnamed protein product [Schistocephalus solidus]